MINIQRSFSILTNGNLSKCNSFITFQQQQKYRNTLNFINSNNNLISNNKRINNSYDLKRSFTSISGYTSPNEIENNSSLENNNNNNNDVDIDEEENSIEQLLKDLNKSQLTKEVIEEIETFQREKLKLKQYEDILIKERLEEYKQAYGESDESVEELTRLFKLQTKLEMEAIEDTIFRYRELVESTKSIQKSTGLGPIRGVMMQWNQSLIDIVKSEYTSMKLRQKETWSDILTSVSAEKVSMIALNQILSQAIVVDNNNNTLTRIRDNIGIAVYSEYRAAQLKSQDPLKYYRDIKSQGPMSLKNMSQLFGSEIITLPTTGNSIENIGKFMTDLILRACVVQKHLGEDSKEVEPAFYLEYLYKSNKKIGQIRCHPNILKMINDGHSLRETVGARLSPMVIKPAPWTSPNNGAYLHYKTFLMRTNGSKMQFSSLFDADLTHIYDGLNALGETPWVINQKVYKVINECWVNGGGLGEIPKRSDHELPQIPDDYATNIESRKQYIKSEQKIKRLNFDLHSLRCDTILKLNVAERFLDKTIYFPHNVDFRGRSYPIPPHLNHLGSDFCRSLLKFKEKRPLTERGLRWLKVHIANLYGVDKIPHEDRVAFTEKQLENGNIRDSVDRPLEGNMWWLKADNPWQTLAACIELVDALDSGNPEAFESNLPIHQDGTCNGLQHYAALGGDELGAAKVNLLPSDRPQDVYTGIAVIVAQNIAKEAEEGNELAQELNGKIDRKIVKQTVMTSVYGVTFIGARDQIQNALSEKFPHYEDDMLFKASSYIAKHTFKSLDQMFLGARSIMVWLAKCASLIAKSGDCVSWTTPLGLPIVQPYRKGGKYKVKTLESDYIIINDDEKLPVDSMKQKSAFPPNFIHSLDSTHMFLTALQCKQKGITYSSVHDSYWTHASTVDQMSEILRDEFIALHSQPILQRLLDWFNAKYPQITFPSMPNRGDLDLSEIKKSKYFFH
ncbi:DNA-dependent RNA polymerase [Tieghemostelium lacteum]|uniref:DNA-directed RNA polymerase n=1 Tax=Tieghemostelium lacteum TaxID=361077 RepID=A0A151Z5F9_TIELA|nr:DNA-dependent RNA polymerase [Tieghemostelium lacteum]|eukprot:KYQ89181.1 DNA-dependent RNA polymerase [Tieghemostelium lacteum]